MWFYTILVVVLLAGQQCSGNAVNCLEKEKSLGVLDFARQSIEKAEDLFPHCFDDDNSTDSSECGKKEKALAFLQIAKDMIATARKTYPTCLDVVTTELPDVTTAATVFPNVTTTDFPNVTTTDFPNVTTTDFPNVTTTDFPNVTTTDFPNATTTDFPNVTATDFPNVTIPVLRDLLPKDCSDVLEHGYYSSGVYKVWPRSNYATSEGILVYCDMETDGGGWTVIQRRGGFSSLENFNRDWQNYKKGFGNLSAEFWLGNDNIYIITNQEKYEVRFDLADFDGNERYAVYKSFQIESEANKYKLHAEGYTGNAGDSLSWENGSPFSTYDRINEIFKSSPPCATSRGTGWWFYGCNNANINGIPNKNANASNTKNLYWRDWKGYQSLASADMKLRRI